MIHADVQLILDKSSELLNKARALFESSNYDESERWANEVLELLLAYADNDDMGDERDSSSQKYMLIGLIAHAYNRLNTISLSRADYPLALSQAENALGFSERIGDNDRKAGVLGNMGTVYMNLSNYRLALDYFGKALVLEEEQGNKAGVAKRLHNVASANRRLSNAELALDSYRKALALADELGDKATAARCLSGIGLVQESLSDYAKALDSYRRALTLAEDIGDKAEVSTLFTNIGSVHWELSDFPTALDYYGKALTLADDLRNKRGVAALLGNIGNVYLSLSEYSIALDYYGKALALQDEIGNKAGEANMRGSLGTVYCALSDYTLALEYYGEALVIEEEIGDKAGMAISLNNMGELHRIHSDFSLALECYGMAMAVAEEIGNKKSMALHLSNMGQTYATPEFEGFDAKQAEEFLLRARAMNDELGTKSQNIDVLKTLSELYAICERWKESREQLKNYYDLESEVKSDAATKQASLMEQRRQAAEREKEMEIERARVTAEKNILNNVLPKEITERLINGENPIADHFDSVSVLFMDIVDFTPLASSITAQQLVHLLNAIFSAADAVMRECGLEKIKTIGDAYMAVAGAPIVQDDHARRAAQAALKLLDVMENLVVSFPETFGDRSWIESIPEIQVRIGLHCGPVAAGVVGENKFLYDLWGDAVNIAARMESYGVAGKVHVSEAFMQSAADAAFHFNERGEIDVKGKGMMRTYFLEKA